MEVGGRVGENGGPHASVRTNSPIPLVVKVGAFFAQPHDAQARGSAPSPPTVALPLVPA